MYDEYSMKTSLRQEQPASYGRGEWTVFKAHPHPTESTEQFIYQHNE